MRHHHRPAQPATFEDLYAEHASHVLRLLWHFGVAQSECEDVAQEVWSAVHRALPSYDASKGTMRAWIGTIAHNEARSWHRMRRRRPEFSASTDAAEQQLAEARTAEMDAEERQRREALGAYFRRAIPNEDQREAFLLHVVEGWTVEEVAEATGVQPSTVRWRLMMARRRLQEEMTEEERRKLLAIVPVMSVDALVRAMRETKFSEDELARVWERVTERIEAQGGSIHDPVGVPAAPSRGPAPRVYTFTPAQLAATLGGTMLLSAVLGAGVLYAFQSSRHEKPSVTTIDAEVPSPLPTEPPPEPVPSASASAAPSVTHRAAAAPWESEAWILDHARKAPPDEALRQADRHALLFPRSVYAAEREEIAIRALVKLGRRPDAEQRAAKLVQWAPQMRPTMETLLGRSIF